MKKHLKQDIALNRRHIIKNLIIISTTALLIISLCSCTNESHNSSASGTSEFDATSAFQNALTSETPSETDINETDLEHAIRLATEFVEEGYYNEGGLLHDFDLDGIPELVAVKGVDYDLVIMDIYKLNSDNPVCIGSIETIYNLNDPYSFSLYHDQNNDNYFYIGNFSVPGKGSSYSQIYSYKFFDDKIIKNEIAYTEFYYTSASRDAYISDNRLFGEKVAPMGCYDSDINYDNELNKYLSQYKKIETVKLSPMWTMGDNYSEKTNKIKEAAQGYSDYSTMPESSSAPKEDLIELGGNYYSKHSYRLTLYIPSNTDLSKLAEFPNLYSLKIYCEDNGTIDISPLLEMKNITSLFLNYDCKINFNYLSQMTWLEYLNVSYDSLDLIKNLKSLTVLKLEALSDDSNLFEPIYALPNLKVITTYYGLTEEQLKAIKKNMPDCLIAFL